MKEELAKLVRTMTLTSMNLEGPSVSTTQGLVQVDSTKNDFSSKQSELAMKRMLEQLK